MQARIKQLSASQRIRRWTIVVVLSLTLVISPSSIESKGDYLQIALPAAGFVCSLANGSAAEYTTRFISMLVVVHGLKQGLGDAEINTRPNGDHEGFPSGHTSAAFFGASSLVNECLTKNWLVQSVILAAATFVGWSRISAERHNITQVLAGIVFGFAAERLCRRYAARIISRRRQNKESKK